MRQKPDADYAKLCKDNYTKIERMIPMRDGIKLFTRYLYTQRLISKYPILMERTPYSCAPYGENNFNTGGLAQTNMLPLRNIFLFIRMCAAGT